MNVYDTITAALADLRKRGFTVDFNLQFDQITCNDPIANARIEDFEVLETYRFEGDTDPADESIVYGIITRNGHKGVLVHAYGTYAEDISDDMIRKLKVRV